MGVIAQQHGNATRTKSVIWFAAGIHCSTVGVQHQMVTSSLQPIVGGAGGGGGKNLDDNSCSEHTLKLLVES
jgi:hypothetical protein